MGSGLLDQTAAFAALPTYDDVARKRGAQAAERHGVLLDAVAEHFNLELTDDELNEYFRAAATPGLEAMIRLDFERNGKMPEARLSAMRLKANDYVTEHASIHIEG